MATAEEQICALKARDPFHRHVLYAHDPGRFPAFSGRSDVRPMPVELEGKALLVSGHHGLLDVPEQGKSDRIICDFSGGAPTEVRPISAVILPERTVIGSGKSNGGLLERYKHY